MEDLKLQDAVDSAFDIFRRCNKYIDETEPWALAKDEAKADRLKTVLYNLSVNIVKGAKLIYSFMPETSEKILQSREFEALEITNIILKSNIGNTEFIANVLNKSKSNFKSKNLVIKFLNSTGKEIGKMQISIPDLVADGETIVDASITEDYVNAYDIIIENVK